MANANRRPYRATTSTGAGTSAVDHDYAVPASKVWQVGLIIVTNGTPATNNTADIQHDSSGSFVNLYDQLSNFARIAFDPLSVFPENIELEASKTLRVAFTRGTSTTASSTIHVRERDQ